MNDDRPGVPVAAPKPLVAVRIDGEEAKVPAGSTLLDACRAAGVDTPTLCWGETLEPKNACRVCVVELEGSRTLVPSCSRRVEPDMVVQTDTERVRHSRKLVLELLGSSVDLSNTPHVAEWNERYDARPDRFGPDAERVERPVLRDNDLYVRDYEKCILCYKCVEACGVDAQNTFAIAVAGRGFDAGIATEWEVPLPDSACVYCGNCIGVCPTGALMAKPEHDLRESGRWNEAEQTRTDTICSYCGVGCTLTLHVQDERIVKATSPLENSTTHGNLCVKGRFGFEFVQPLLQSG